MPKRLPGLCLAALLVGLTGFAPYAGGQCALRGDAMPGMATHAGMAMGGVHGGIAGHGQAQGHLRCCGGCLDPCSGAGLAALPAVVSHAFAALPAARRAALPAPRTPDLPRFPLLPFANGPPSLLG